MPLTTEEVKILVDIGLGALSFLLWLRQGKINKAQQDLDSRQNKTTEDLTTMVKDHETRIITLERKPKRRRRAKKAAAP